MNRRSFLAASAAMSGGFLPGGLAPAQAADPERQFQLGCVTYNLLKDMDLETIIHTLETTGLAAVELRTTHKHGVEPSIGPDARAAVRERFTRTKVRLLSYGTECEFQSPDAAVRQHQVEIGKSFVDLARDTGAIGVKVRPNGLPQGVPYETTIRNIGQGLRDLGEYGQSKGIEIWMEVHGPSTGSVKQAFDLLGPFIRNVHIVDLYNSYPWREFFRLLAASGYKRYTLAEVAESADTVRFLRYYSALWHELTA